MRTRRLACAMTALAVGAVGAGSAQATDDRKGGQRFGQAIDTRADYTPYDRFRPLESSSACEGAPSGRGSKPFDVPPRYRQQVLVEETDPLTRTPEGRSRVAEDLFDMNTQNEFGTDAGRYLYRTHEVGGAAQGTPPEEPGGGQVTVTDLKTGVTRNLAERNHWERFDGIAWTPWGTILAAEETINQSFRDPNVPQANGGLVYELFVDRERPWRLDPSRERITAPEDGTTDTTKDGIRARPALGAKSHEGLRFDRRGHFYGIAESRGESQGTGSTSNVSGGIFRFVPDRKGDLSTGVLSAYDSPNGKDGEGRWQPLDRTAVREDADRAAFAAGVNRYERPEDVETGESTGVDRLNGGNTLYVAITDDGDESTIEEGVFNIDLTRPERPFGYRYVGAGVGNTVDPAFTGPDNLALDGRGNLAITEDGGATGGGDDVFIAEPPRRGRHTPARTVQRFLSSRDCEAEPSGIYFALRGTERWTEGRKRGLKQYDERTVNGETLFVNRQHAEDSSPVDQLVAISPRDAGERDRGRRGGGRRR